MVIGFYFHRFDQVEESLTDQICVKITSFRSKHLWFSDLVFYRWVSGILVILGISSLRVFLCVGFYLLGGYRF